MNHYPNLGYPASQRLRPVSLVSSKRPMEKKRNLSRWEKAGIPFIILIVVWGVYSVTQPSTSIQPHTTSSIAVSSGSYAPDFTLPMVGPSGPTGGSVSLSSLRGRVVFLEFMEPWCPHCQSMAPVLEQLHQRYGGNVSFISVAGPWNGANQNDVASFERQYGSSWSYLYDSSGSIMNMYGVSGTPTFFIINRNGSIAASLQGDQNYASLENLILQSLRS